MAKKPSLTLHLGTNGLKVTSEPPPIVGQAGCLQGQDCSAVTHPSSSHDKRYLFTNPHKPIEDIRIPPIRPKPTTREKQKIPYFVGDFFKWCSDIAKENKIKNLVDNKKRDNTAP
ncbi:hypothetical protein J6590_002861 [Homalodisca vitripennis]|nr:hypothetical protein J6590_002861 [Homalodisca vitripennis]